MSNSKEEMIDTRITDHWGVKWSPMEIVRDFLQNFYDDNRIEDIKINFKGNTVTVSAPAQFDYKELLYMGSDKGEDKIGQYGEGFKAATLNTLRNHNCSVQMIIGVKKLEFFLENKKIGRREKKVVMCRVTTNGKIAGTKLILSNCPQEILEEFKFGLNYFYYESNPLFGETLAKTYENDIFVYKSTNKNGYVFYGKLLRAKLDIPIIFVCNRQYKTIDEKIRYDRDRKAFNDEVLNKFLRQVCRPLNHNVKNIVKFLQPWWYQGHKVLSALANSVYYYFKMEFPDNYYARNSLKKNYNIDMLAEIDRTTKQFREKKFIECPQYMANFGMKTAISVIEDHKKKLQEKNQKIYTRKPDKLERQALEILSDFIMEIDPFLAGKFSGALYTIGDSDEIVGELRNKRSWREQHVYLSKKFFSFDFSCAMAVLLHEWSHIYGYDGSRGFTDALTEFISHIIKERDMLNDYEKQWNIISSKIINTQNKIKGLTKLISYIDRLSSKQKSALLKNIPEDALMKLLEKEKFL